jgi:hypothetical protein
MLLNGDGVPRDVTAAYLALRGGAAYGDELDATPHYNVLEAALPVESPAGPLAEGPNLGACDFAQTVRKADAFREAVPGMNEEERYGRLLQCRRERSLPTVVWAHGFHNPLAGAALAVAKFRHDTRGRPFIPVVFGWPTSEPREWTFFRSVPIPLFSRAGLRPRPLDGRGRPPAAGRGAAGRHQRRRPQHGRARPGPGAQPPGLGLRRQRTSRERGAGRVGRPERLPGEDGVADQVPGGQLHGLRRRRRPRLGSIAVPRRRPARRPAPTSSQVAWAPSTSRPAQGGSPSSRTSTTFQKWWRTYPNGCWTSTRLSTGS